MQEFLKKLNGLRTLLVYDNVYTLEFLIFNEILPIFKDLKIYHIVYSECTNRTLKTASESFARFNRRVGKILSNSSVVKIGKFSKVPFGRLHKFISLNDNYLEILKDVLEDLRGLILFHGFSILVLNSDQRDLVEIFDSIPECSTLICECNKSVYSSEFNLFFDAVLALKVDEMSLGEFQVLEVLHSSKFDLIPGTCERFRWEYVRV